MPPEEIPGQTFVRDSGDDQTWTLTAGLRWKQGVLEQLMISTAGEQRWEPVPQAEETPTG